jgi:tetratricopeptide (TPR) repeat protein
MEHFSRRKLELSLCFLALGLFFFYIKTASPAFPPNDSPETIAAAYGLGIQHPPGYPLHSLLGRLVTMGWEAGSPAWRVNNESALFGILACVVLALLGLRISREVFPELPPAGALAASLSAGIFLGLSKTFWQQATEAKGGIYLLNLLLLALLMALALPWKPAFQAASGPGPARQRAAWFGLAAGLSLANHYLSAGVVLLILAPVGYFSWRGPGFKARDLVVAAGLAALGASLYGYLPLRAAFHPAANLGDPETWAQFKWVALRAGYTQATVPNSLGHRLLQSLTWLKFTVFDATPLMPALAALGAWGLWLRRRAFLVPLGAIYLAVAGAVVWVNRTEAGVQWLNDIFLLPAQMQLCLLAGLGLAALAAGLPRLKKPALYFLAPLFLALVLAAAHFQDNDRAGEYSAYDFGRGLALSLKPRGLYLAEGDFHVMPLFYAQGVEGRRRDLAWALNVLLHMPFARQELRRARPDLAIPDANDDREAVKELLKMNLGKAPLAFSPHHPTLDGLDLGRAVLRVRGLVEEAVPANGDAGGADLSRSLPRRFGIEGLAWERREPLVKSLLPWYGVCLVNAGNCLMPADPAGAAASYQAALRMPGEKPEAKIWFNLGKALMLDKRYSQAEAAFQSSLEKDPSLEAGRQALAEVRPHLVQAAPENGITRLLIQADRLSQEPGKQKEALALYEKAAASGRVTAAVWRNIGVLNAQLNLWDQAEPAFQRAEALEPKNAELVKMRALCLEKMGRLDDERAVLKAGAERTRDKELRGIVEKLQRP